MARQKKPKNTPRRRQGNTKKRNKKEFLQKVRDLLKSFTAINNPIFSVTYNYEITADNRKVSLAVFYDVKLKNESLRAMEEFDTFFNKRTNLVLVYIETMFYSIVKKSLVETFKYFAQITATNLNPLARSFKRPIWAWPRATRRRSGKVVTSPRDIIDTGRLYKSMTAQILKQTDQNTFSGVYSWNTDYAKDVLYGTANFPGRNFLQDFTTNPAFLNKFKDFLIKNMNIQSP